MKSTNSFTKTVQHIPVSGEWCRCTTRARENKAATELTQYLGGVELSLDGASRASLRYTLYTRAGESVVAPDYGAGIMSCSDWPWPVGTTGRWGDTPVGGEQELVSRRALGSAIAPCWVHKEQQGVMSHTSEVSQASLAVIILRIAQGKHTRDVASIVCQWGEMGWCTIMVQAGTWLQARIHVTQARCWLHGCT